MNKKTLKALPIVIDKSVEDLSKILSNLGFFEVSLLGSAHNTHVWVKADSKTVEYDYNQGSATDNIPIVLVFTSQNGRVSLAEISSTNAISASSELGRIWSRF